MRRHFLRPPRPHASKGRGAGLGRRTSEAAAIRAAAAEALSASALRADLDGRCFGIAERGGRSADPLFTKQSLDSLRSLGMVSEAEGRVEPLLYL